MTKIKLCGKMLDMKKILSNKFFNSIVTLFITLVLCMVSLCIISVTNTAKAQSNSPNAGLFLPITPMEYNSLNNPVDVYSDDSVTAVAQSDNTLIISKGGKFEQTNASFSDIKLIKKFDDNTLLVADNGSIYKINLTTLEKSEMRDTEGELVGGQYFDINGNYLITAFSNSVYVYAINNGQLSNKVAFSASGSFPIAITSDNTIFFVKNGNLVSLKANGNLTTPLLIKEGVTPAKMIADNHYLYYIPQDTQSEKVCRISLSDHVKTSLTVLGDKNYDLSNLSAPSGLNFKNGNLLITDTDIDAVQEFRVVDNSLEFTGFAIASGKTAYNRANVSATNISRTGDKIALLESNRISLIAISSDKYAKENYIDFFAEDLGGIMPNALALGLDYLLLSYNQGTTSSTLKTLRLSDGQLTGINLPYTIVEDVCYQSGYFYTIITDNNKNNVYRVCEGGAELELVIENADIDATRIAVDVLGNVFLSDSYGNIKSYIKADDYQSISIESLVGVKKMQTDLGGNLFALSSDGLYRWDGTHFNQIQLNNIESSDTVKSFTLSFDTDDVYLLYNNKEYIALANELGNIALSQVVVPDEYITTATTTSADRLKMATVDEGANVYSVQKASDKFDYLGLINKTDEYVVICDIIVDQTLTLTALAEKNGVVLVNKTQISVSEPIVSEAPDKAFVTTDVNAYYFPIINRNTDYALSDGQVIRLKKSTRITPIHTITVKTEHNGVISDAQFYLACFSDGQIERTGYIPVSFTVETLAKDFEWQELSIESIKATTLYSDEDLTQKITQLSDGNIRLIEKTGSYAKIALKTEDGYIVGYISVTAIVDAPRIAIRNILLILVVVASICGTTTFFILRKKKY